LLVPFFPLIGLVFLTDANIFVFIGMGVWLLIGLSLYSIRAGSIATRYKKNYKNEVIPRLLALIDPQLGHLPESGIPSSLFVASELYTSKPDRYSTEDLITGKYGKTNLQLAEVHAEDRRTTTDSKGRTRTSYVTIFDGLFLIADFHKHFHGRTFIFPDKAESLFGGVGRFFQKMGGRSGTSLIQLEDPEFEEKFAVYSTDEVEVRYLLSTAMMLRILEMQARFGRDVRLAFKDSSLILAVPHSKPFLEPRTSTPATDWKQAANMLTDLRFFLETIEELDLNTRIWTKE
ncbi:MAG: DUF3137 domain-containing protein, partial [Verrucomicrobiota bacterium]